jgi:hypothetical protein
MSSFMLQIPTASLLYHSIISLGYNPPPPTPQMQKVKKATVSFHTCNLIKIYFHRKFGITVVVLLYRNSEEGNTVRKLVNTHLVAEKKVMKKR